MTLEVKQTDEQVIGTLVGRLDTLAAAQFSRDMEALIDLADKHILLDCKDLEFISSSGLRLFLTLRKQTLAKGGDITIQNVNESIRSVFTLTGFYSLFKFI